MRRAVGMLEGGGGRGGLLRRFSLVDGMKSTEGEMTKPCERGPCLSNQRRRRGNQLRARDLGLRRIAAVINQQKGKGGPCVSCGGGRVQARRFSSTPSPFLVRDGMYWYSWRIRNVICVLRRRRWRPFADRAIPWGRVRKSSEHNVHVSSFRGPVTESSKALLWTCVTYRWSIGIASGAGNIVDFMEAWKGARRTRAWRSKICTVKGLHRTTNGPIKAVTSEQFDDGPGCS